MASLNRSALKARLDELGFCPRTRQKYRVLFYQERDARKAGGLDAKTATAQTLDRWRDFLEGRVNDAPEPFDPMAEGLPVESASEPDAHPEAPAGLSPPRTRPLTTRDQEDLCYQRLAMAAQNRTCSQRKTAAWVYRMIEMPVADIDPDRVPDPGAVGLLRYARDNRADFYKNFIAGKMIGTSSSDEEDPPYKDTGESDEELLKYLREQMAAGAGVVFGHPV